MTSCQGSVCDAGKFGNRGQSVEGVCTRCQVCPAGKYFESDCKSCPYGKFSSREGATSCETAYQSDEQAPDPCPPGKYGGQSGTSAESAQSCEDCSAGTFWNSAGGSCLPCPQGKYSSAPAAIACTESGVNCPSGKHGATSMTSSALAGVCNDCPAGQYGASLLMTINCIPCPAGKYSRAAGLTSCEGTSLLCPSGKFGDSGQSAPSVICRSCPAGKAALYGDGRCYECMGQVLQFSSLRQSAHITTLEEASSTAISVFSAAGRGVGSGGMMLLAASGVVVCLRSRRRSAKSK